MPKIINIGQCFTELFKNNTGTVFLRHGVLLLPITGSKSYFRESMATYFINAEEFITSKSGNCTSSAQLYL